MSKFDQVRRSCAKCLPTPHNRPTDRRSPAIFFPSLPSPRKKSHEKRVDSIREQTPRNSGDSLETIIQRVNQSAQGWFNFYRHCHWSIFRKYDEMVRRRLRRILRKRHRQNPKHLACQHRWTNAFFTNCGLLSLNAAHMRFVQSIGTY